MKRWLSIGLLSLYLGAVAGLCVDIDVCCLSISGWHTDAFQSSHHEGDVEDCCSLSQESCCSPVESKDCGGECPTAEISIDFQDEFYSYAPQERLEIPVQETELWSSVDFSNASMELDSDIVFPPDERPPFHLSDSPYIAWCSLIFYG